MARLIQADRKSTVTQITTLYNCGEQKSFSECTSKIEADRLQHQVPLLSAKNRKLRQQWAHAHQNWTVEDWKV